MTGSPACGSPRTTTTPSSSPPVGTSTSRQVKFCGIVIILPQLNSRPEIFLYVWRRHRYPSFKNKMCQSFLSS
jgi:hypothetical protein